MSKKYNLIEDYDREPYCVSCKKDLRRIGKTAGKHSPFKNTEVKLHYCSNRKCVRYKLYVEPTYHRRKVEIEPPIIWRKV